MRIRGVDKRSAIVVLLVALASACGPYRYVTGVTNDASDAVEVARQARAEELAPYWWTRAVTFLARARHEAADADWQAATRFGRLAEQAARKAAEEAAAAAADPSKRPIDGTEDAREVAPAKESSLIPAGARDAVVVVAGRRR